MTVKAEQTALRARQTGDRAALFWSERGAVCCARHAPYLGSDTWRWERCRQMTDAERQEWTRTVGQPPCCEVCREAK
jgi:hypothetical protein